MHDTVNRIWKHIRKEGAQPEVALLVSRRLQEAQLARALAEPMSIHYEGLYLEAVRWIRHTDRLTAEDETASAAEILGEILFSSRHIAVVIEPLIGFLERAEDQLSERDEITHRESPYEREVAPFSRLDSTRTFRTFLTAHAGFDANLAGKAAQVQADLLKVVYLERRMRKDQVKVPDLYAMIMELNLDARRHLVPAVADGSEFLVGLRRAAETT